MSKLVSSLKNGVATLRFNDPKKLNAWSVPMMLAVRAEMERTAADDAVRATILTGTGRFYSAGVDLASIVRPGWPRVVLAELSQKNQALFDMFLDYPKPLFVAANGPAVGATVTSATLCERIYCAPEATFSTPFVRLGLVPEGCSSVWFERTMGPEVAHRLLKDGATLSAAEALEAGMVEQVVPSEGLLDATQAAAEAWVASGRDRRIDELGAREELKEVNARESDALAQARVVCCLPIKDRVGRIPVSRMD